MLYSTATTPLEAILAADLKDDTDRLILADYLEENFGLDSQRLRQVSNPRTYHVRWCIRSDMPAILAAEASLAKPWREDNYLSHLRQRNCIGMVAEEDEKVLGVMVYEVHKHHLKLLRLLVFPEHRDRGVLDRLTWKLASKLSSHRRTSAQAEVACEDMATICAFLRCGWKPEGVENGNLKLALNVA